MSYTFENKLENKVIRPSGTSRNYYHSDRRPTVNQYTTPAHSNRTLKGIVVVLLLLVLGVGGTMGYAAMRSPAAKPVAAKAAVAKAPTTKSVTATTPAASAAPAAVAAVNECAANTVAQNVVVSISQRHLWACQGTTSQYDSPVITGIAYLAADKTPTGTYHVYGKVRDTVLTGSDSTGSWNDPVSYWMPFLNNQYGTYGFHDATWRSDTQFGNVDPNSANGSHGCVELPLATAAWIYNWAPIGTTAPIES